jgi:hypothetical protein
MTAELMHTTAVTCRTSATIRDVARLMRDRNVGTDSPTRS